MEITERTPARQRLTARSPLLIGLCAPAMGSGKTEVANALVENHGFVKLQYAATLKSMIASLLQGSGMSEWDAAEFIADPELKETPLAILGGKTPRHAMQTLGTEWGRNCITENLWVGITIAKAKALMSQGRNVVIDDMRFLNEAEAVRAAGGTIIRVSRPTAQITSAHASEGELNSYHADWVIPNDSSLATLRLRASVTVGLLQGN